MKNYTILFITALLLFVSCSKDSLKNCSTPIDTVSLAGAVVLKEGSFVFASSKFKGIARMYEQQNGRYVAGLEQMYIAAEGDMQVYLSKTSALSSASFKLFSARSINGDKYYMLPADFAVDGFNYLIIADDRRGDALGTAVLK